MASIQKRVSRLGKASYRAQVRLKGQPPQTASFERKTDAQRWVQKIETELREGRYFPTSHANQYSLADLIDRYISDTLPHNPNPQGTKIGQLLWWRDELGNYPLMNITTDLVVEARDKLLKRKTPNGSTLSTSSANRYVAALSHAFSVAIKEWRWLQSSPVSALKKLPEPRGRVRFLSPGERDALLAACQIDSNPLLYPIVVLALSTGARRGEILNLRWDDVDMKIGRLVFHQTKNNERRGIPLKGHALKVVKTLAANKEANCDFLFPNQAETGPIDIRLPWSRAVSISGLKDFRFHDLRHTTASYLAMGGATPHEIAEVLGHKNLEMTKRYSHLTEGHVSGVLDSLANEMFGNDNS